jgi:hypothetical protein
MYPTIDELIADIVKDGQHATPDLIDRRIAEIIEGNGATSTSTTDRACLDLSICSTCNKTSTVETPLNLCGGCKKIRYCSQACQKKDWREHKKKCKLKAEDYFRLVAVKDPKSQQLAKEIGLDLSRSDLL